MDLRNLRLRFDADLEREFREEYAKKSLRHVRLVLIVGAIFYGFFGILDAALMPALKGATWLIRFGLVVPVSIIIFASTWSRFFLRHMQVLLSSWITLGGIGIVVMIAIVPRELAHGYYTGLILVFIVGYTFARIRFTWATVSGWAIVFLYEAVEIFINDASMRVFLNNNFFFIGANLLGMLSCWSIEFHIRRDFHLARLLRLEREKVVQANLDLSDANDKLATANARLEAMAINDGLTGIPNRRRFDEVLDQEWARCRREKEPLSLILCDIDHFKQYNDTYGHQAGDACLKRVAKALASFARRPADLAARYGGEEFALILPNTPERGAMHVAEGVRSAIEGLGIVHERSSAAEHVTLSLGVSTVVPPRNQVPDALLKSADEGLYKCKEEGRNRTCFQGPLPGA